MEYYKERVFIIKICNEELKKGVNYKCLKLCKLFLVVMDRESIYFVQIMNGVNEECSFK